MRRGAAGPMRVALAAAGILLAPRAAGGAPTDLLTLASGDRLDAVVVRVDAEGVWYTLPGVRGGEILAPSERVASVVYHDTPGGLLQGEQALERGDAPEAIREFERALADVRRGRSRRFHRQEAVRGIARAHSRAGHGTEAMGAWLSLVAEVPDSVHAREAWQEALGWALRLRDKDALKSVADRLRKQPVARKMAPQADLARAALAEWEGRFQEARSAFGRLGEGDPSWIREESRLGITRCLVSEHRSEDLRRFCESVLKDDQAAPRVRARAYNLLGDSLFQQAERGSDPLLWKGALLRYLRTVVLYPPAAGGECDDHAKALARAARCFERLGASFREEASREEYRRRADGLYREVAGQYPESPWAKRARGTDQNPRP